MNKCVYVVQHHEDLAGEYPCYEIYGVYENENDAIDEMNRKFDIIKQNFDSEDVEIVSSKACCTLTTAEGEAITIDVRKYEVK